MGIICDTCGRDIDALGQDNMGVDAPLCEDCWSGQKSLAVQDRHLQNLHRENERLRSENKALADNLAEVGRKLADARQRLRSDGPADCKRLLASFCEEADYLEWLKAEYDDGTVEWEER